MKSYLKFAAIALVSLAAATGCKKKPDQIEPAEHGERNDSCRAKNDCGAGLSCLSGRCSPTEFSLVASGKECVEWECDEAVDCCGDMPMNAPPECNGRETTCELSTFPDCNTFDTCTADLDCGSGSCGTGFCEAGGGSCGSDADCAPVPTLCSAVTGFCSDGFTACTFSSDCPTEPDTCGIRRCECGNPAYNPTAPICSDPMCDDVCTKVCADNNRCVEDTSCETDVECGFGNTCTADGRCVECETNEDCDEDNDEACNALGVCERPCEFDQECGRFEACEAGECVPKGCQNDKECVLDPALVTSQDQRLAVCRPAAEGL